ncbi:hypothetical protein EYF80_006619 [Liparis tanakae]|uniref:Uncharacterized protein n=1 Tax=Liparis tanakae TaxID=230148 RepID=A0A4Z2J0E0_9TELE|nr:hypothetical protein EYF80_006619 [Liparis tanakae]
METDRGWRSTGWERAVGESAVGESAVGENAVGEGRCPSGDGDGISARGCWMRCDGTQIECFTGLWSRIPVLRPREKVIEWLGCTKPKEKLKVSEVRKADEAMHSGTQRWGREIGRVELAPCQVTQELRDAKWVPSMYLQGNQRGSYAWNRVTQRYGKAYSQHAHYVRDNLRQTAPRDQLSFNQ